MRKEYKSWFSPSLGKEMGISVYGHAGKPFLFIPCQDGRNGDLEGFHMTDTLSGYLENGQMIVFSIDTIDKETWSDRVADAYTRARRYEQWISYICYEVVPMIHDWLQNGDGIVPFGCSLGATHAANLYLRRPDLFDGCLALSGIYTATYGFDQYMDEVVYQNSPVDYMANLPADHPYISEFQKHRAVICCGTGAWELPETTFCLKEIFEQKQIPIWVDIWGSDVNHDWPWWYKQAEYFVPYLLYLK